MKVLNHILWILLILNTVASGQIGKIEYDLSLKSSVLEEEQKYSIYLPKDYEEVSYPVLYMLNGISGDKEKRAKFEELLKKSFDPKQKDSLHPMIIVAIYLDEESGGYYNDILKKRRFEDYFFEEFMPYIEKKYRIRGSSESRAIGGNSLGGGAAYMFGLHHPEMFTTVCPINAYVGSLDYKKHRKDIRSGSLKLSDSVIQKDYNRHHALSLINNTPSEKIKHLRWYIDCNTDDRIYQGNRLISKALELKTFDYRFIPRENAGSGTFINESAPAILKYVSEGFRKAVSGR